MDSFLLLRRLVAAIVFKGQTVSDYWWSRRTIFLTVEVVQGWVAAGGGVVRDPAVPLTLARRDEIDMLY